MYVTFLGMLLVCLEYLVIYPKRDPIMFFFTFSIKNELFAGFKILYIAKTNIHLTTSELTPGGIFGYCFGLVTHENAFEPWEIACVFFLGAFKLQMLQSYSVVWVHGTQD